MSVPDEKLLNNVTYVCGELGDLEPIEEGK
jgi:hypothetical protein